MKNGRICTYFKANILFKIYIKRNFLKLNGTLLIYLIIDIILFYIHLLSTCF